MSGFTPDLSKLDWNLDGAAREDGTFFDASHAGIVPEPTEGRLSAYLNALTAVTGAEATPEGANEALDAAVPDGPTTLDGAAAMRAVRVAISDLCAGSPSAEIVAQMPPRLLKQFARWLGDELIADPKE